MTPARTLTVAVAVALAVAAPVAPDARARPAAPSTEQVQGGWTGRMEGQELETVTGRNAQAANLSMAPDGSWRMVTRSGGQSWTAEGTSRPVDRELVLDGTIVSGLSTLLGTPVRYALREDRFGYLTGWGDSFFGGRGVQVGVALARSAA